MLFNVTIFAAISALCTTAALHSWAGEAYLIRPLLKYRGNRVLENHLARSVLRFAWHITSFFWLILAGFLYATAFHPQALVPILLVTIGSSFLAVGVFSLAFSKGRHIGWPLLVLTVALTLMAFRLT